MTRRAILASVALAAVLAPSVGCRPKVAPAPPRADLVALLPDPDDGHVGSATVMAAGAEVRLTAANQATHVATGQAPTAPEPIAAEEIERRFGSALAARPLAPREFLLYFETGGDTLTAESQALLPQVVEFVRNRPAPDVSVIGHTDTTGDAKSNAELGMRRAILIRNLLLKIGLDPAHVDVASHGEADLLVATPDNTAEPKNRRVEVTVR